MELFEERKLISNKRLYLFTAYKFSKLIQQIERAYKLLEKTKVWLPAIRKELLNTIEMLSLGLVSQIKHP